MKWSQISRKTSSKYFWNELYCFFHLLLKKYLCVVVCICVWYSVTAATVIAPKLWYGSFHVSVVSFYLIIRTKEKILAWSRYLRLAGFEITIQSTKKLSLFFHYAVGIWACTVKSLLTSKKYNCFFIFFLDQAIYS